MANYNPEDWRQYVSKVPGAVSTVPAERPGEKNPDANKESWHSENSESQRIADAITAVNRTLADQGGANRSEERREDTGNKWLQGLTLAFVIATTIGIFWQASIFNSQLSEMKNASSQTGQLIEANAKLAQAATDQAKAAAKQAEATDKEATAMSDSAQVQRDNMIAAGRAWVGPRNARIDGAIAVGKPLDINIEYANTGREPAIDFVNTIDGFAETAEEETGGKTVQRIFTYFQNCQTNATLQFGQVVFPATGFSSYNLSSQIPAETIDQDLIDGKKALIIQGCFLYKSFNVLRHSYFCYFYKAAQTKAANLNICLIGHYAD